MFRSFRKHEPEHRLLAGYVANYAKCSVIFNANLPMEEEEPPEVPGPILPVLRFLQTTTGDF